jgi:hypothetical protein
MPRDVGHAVIREERHAKRAASFERPNEGAQAYFQFAVPPGPSPRVASPPGAGCCRFR